MYHGGRDNPYYAHIIPPLAVKTNGAGIGAAPEAERRGFYRKGGVLWVTLKWKRYAFLVLLFFLFLYFIITGAMSLYYAGEVIRPSQSPVAPIDRNIAYPYTSMSFRSREDNVLLNGWYFNAKNTNGILIIVHGFGGNRFPFGERTLDFIEAIIANDFNVLAFDLRNSGGSGSGTSSFGLHEKNDVLGAVDYARSAGYENIAILGVSTGANAAAIAGAQASVEEVGALILDSPIVDMSNFIMNLVREINPKLPDFPFGIEAPIFTGLYINGDIRDANAAKNLDGFMPRHVQIIYGNNDEIVSLADITGLYEGYMSRAVGKISIWNVPGASHGECFYAAGDEYIERVVTFLKRVFA